MEQSFVAWAKMRARRLPTVKLGIGDDAAVIAGNGDQVITTDSLMDGVHFILSQTDARRIGRKAVNVNLSDVAAMGAQPESILVSFCLPLEPPNEQSTDALAAELFEGICAACEDHQIALAGGDTNCWDGPLVLAVTATGRLTGKPWTRSGAQPDDLIVVTGPLGGSISGKHFDFTPRFDIVGKIANQVEVHAAMDISDGLSVDLLRMCDASNCGAILELGSIPITSAAASAAQNGSEKTAVEHALGDGEDFELLLAISPAEYQQLVELVGEENAIVCGTFTSRTGLWMRDGGKIRQLTSSGYVHGR